MDVEITLLGGFRVSVGGVAVPDDAWGRRTAAGLVKLLALAPGRRLHREQVIDALWPGVDVADAAPRLHKAAHFARRSLGEQTSGIVLRGDMVLLLPDDQVYVDAVRFDADARAALEAGDADAAGAIAGTYGGILLPDDLYEPWTEEARERLRILSADLLRRAGRWEVLLQDDPTNEEAHVALVRRMARAGDVRGGLRQLERLDRALRAELGTVPGPEAVRLRSSLQAALGHDAGTAGGSGRTLVGRQEALTALDRAMVRARAGRGTTVLVTGPTGVGKTAVLAVVARNAQDQDWRIGRGAASSVEGPWAYSAVLEALADLCRRHPTILDGLDDAYRTEIDRALSGRALPWSGESAHQRLFIAAAELVRLAAAGHGLMLAIEDLHEADEASLRLVHYLARCAVDAPVMLLLTARAAAGVTDPCRPGQPSRPRGRITARAGAADPRPGHGPARRALPRPEAKRGGAALDDQRRAAVHVAGVGACGRPRQPGGRCSHGRTRWHRPGLRRLHAAALGGASRQAARGNRDGRQHRRGPRPRGRGR